MTARVRALCAASVFAAAGLHAYVRETYSGKPLTRTRIVSFMVGPHAKAGLTNGAGNTVITPESDPVAALQAAMSTWNTASGADLDLSVTAIAIDRETGGDGRNVITFEDTPSNRSVVGSAIAITTYYFIPSRGVITDSDIVFSPDITFATTPTLGAYDLQSIATHELGHAIGVGHTPLRSAVMFPYSLPEDTSARTLSQDEIAFVRDVHTRESPLGSISGTLTTPSGKAPASALVLMLNCESGVAAASYSGNGSYAASGLPPGDYLVAAYPVAPLADSNSDDFDTPDWQASFAAGANAQAISVAAGGLAQADIAVPDGPAKLSIDSAYFGDDEFRIASGTSVDVSLFGSGFPDQLVPEDMEVYGGGATVRADSIEVFPDLGMVFFTLDVPAVKDWTDAAIVLRAGDLVAVYAGIRIAPAGAAFAPSGVLNAATFRAGALAPGELVSIFGTGIGPDKGVAASFDEHVGFPTAVQDTTVEIAGIPTPLMYVSSTQINLQVPFEVAGLASASVRVRRSGTLAEAILPVADASPGIFGSLRQAAILNEDGTLNNSDQPALRGHVITVFATGQGMVEPALATNRVAPLSPLCRSPNVKATIGDQPARVDFAGMAPGFVGLWQLNIVVPDDAPDGWAHIVLTVNDAFNSPSEYVYVSTAQ